MRRENRRLTAQVVGRLEPHAEAIRQLAQRQDLEVTMQLVRYVNDDEDGQEGIVGWHLDCDALAFLVSIGASIDADECELAAPSRRRRVGLSILGGGGHLPSTCAVRLRAAQVSSGSFGAAYLRQSRLLGFDFTSRTVEASLIVWTSGEAEFDMPNLDADVHQATVIDGGRDRLWQCWAHLAAQVRQRAAILVGMTYDLAVWEGDRPEEADAGVAFGRLYDEYLGTDVSTPPSPAIAGYVAALLDRWFEMGAPEDVDDTSPWSDGPLINNASGPIIYFAMRPSMANDVSAECARMASERGLVCFDPQWDRLRPSADES